MYGDVAFLGGRGLPHQNPAASSGWNFDPDPADTDNLMSTQLFLQASATYKLLHFQICFSSPNVFLALG